MRDDDEAIGFFHGFVALLSLVILVVIVGAVAWFALDALEWLAGVMRGNG